MGRASQAHHVENGHLRVRRCLLLDEGDAAGNIETGQCGDICISQRNDTAPDVAQPADETQEAGFARPVGAKQAKRLAGCHVDADAVDDHRAAG